MNTSERPGAAEDASQPWLVHRFGQIWRIAATAPTPSRSNQPLPEAVLQRAARFARDDDRNRYLNVHRALHAALAAAMPTAADVPPTWRTGPWGKPELGLGPAFNLSRRDGWAAFIIGHDTVPLGLDLEVMHEIDDPLGLACEVFTPTEIADLEVTPQAERSRAFLRGWTRKEAVMKATGLGATLVPRSFHVGLEPVASRVQARFGDARCEVELESLRDEDPTLIAVARIVGR